MSTQPLNKLSTNMQQISFLIRDLMILSSLTRDFLSDSVGLTPSEAILVPLLLPMTHDCPSPTERAASATSCPSYLQCQRAFCCNVYLQGRDCLCYCCFIQYFFPHFFVVLHLLSTLFSPFFYLLIISFSLSIFFLPVFTIVFFFFSTFLLQCLLSDFFSLVSILFFLPSSSYSSITLRQQGAGSRSRTSWDTSQ